MATRAKPFAICTAPSILQFRPQKYRKQLQITNQLPLNAECVNLPRVTRLQRPTLLVRLSGRKCLLEAGRNRQSAHEPAVHKATALFRDRRADSRPGLGRLHRQSWRRRICPRHGYDFAPVHNQLKTHRRARNLAGITQHLIAAFNFTGDDKPATVPFGIPDGGFPVVEELFKLNSLWLALKLFWNNGYSNARCHLDPSLTRN